jgi:hypothetical protein
MFGYALLLALKLEFGYRPFLEGRHLEHLSYFFDNIDQVESLNALCDEGNYFPWRNSSETLLQLGSPEFKKGKYIDYLKEVSK